MKEKIHYTVRQNFFWYFKRVRKYHPILIGQMIVLVILEALQAGLTVMLPTVLVNSLAQQLPLKTVALGIFGLGLGLAIVTYLIGFVEAGGDGPKIDVRSMIGLETQREYLSTCYDNLENSEFRILYELAQDHGLNSNASGAESFYTHFALLLRKFVSFILFCLTLTVLAPIVVVIVLVTTVINYFALKNVRLFREKISKPWGEVSARSHYLERNAYEVANGKDIRLYRMDNWYEDHLQKNIAESNGWQKKLSTRKFMSDGLQDVTMFGRNLVAYLYLVVSVSRGQIGLTQFTLYFSILNQLTTYLNDLTTTANNLGKASQDLNYIRHFLDVVASEPTIGTLTPEIKALGQAENFQFELVDVSYTYPHRDEPTLKNINLTIAAGEKLALVGANGAGKSTLVKLLSGLITPSSGEIYLNGIKLSDIPREFYYQLIAPVFQETTIFAFDLGQNVALATDYDEERVRQCLIQAGLGEKLSQLPDGLATQLTTYVDLSGVDFSGGEQQKVMLARALYKDAGMLILDEPTAALDALAENELYEKYNDLTVGKTSLFISHRLASTRFCDRIIFLSEGGISESGTHDELVKAGSRYAEMYEIQSHYYQKEVREDGTK